MVESMVLARLHADGVFPWLGAAGGRSTLRLCFVMRRHDAFKYSFAAAVGKRMASERLLSSNRASIIEHHRSASWAEREYMSLYRHMSANAGAFSQALQGAEDGELLQDYTDMERKDLEMQRVRDARRYVEQATGQRQP